ncbi:microfibril-associated glycoprotein 4-like [Styela clava]
MLFLTIILLFGLYTSSSCNFVPRDYGLCSQVYQMYEYCSGQSTDETTTVVNERRGKAGPPGPPGIPGSPGVVNVALIDTKISEKFAELEKQNNKSLEQCQTKLSVIEKQLEDLQINDCSKVPREKASDGRGGVFNIYPLGFERVETYCDLTTDGGGWLVFQRRMDGSVDFFRKYNDYVHGFGVKHGEYWLGLKLLNRLTSSREYELRIDLEDWDGNRKFAKYSSFKIGNSASGYQLTIGGYSGNAGDSMNNGNGRSFSTKDNDSDNSSSQDCATLYKGAWWYNNCHHANLNGFYFVGGTHKSFADGIEWHSWKEYHYSLKFTEMKIRAL